MYPLRETMCFKYRIHIQGKLHNYASVEKDKGITNNEWWKRGMVHMMRSSYGSICRITILLNIGQQHVFCWKMQK